MDHYSIQITEPAEKDLRAIGSYISKELLEPETARDIIAKIAIGIHSLEKFPFRYALVTDPRLAFKGIRKIMVVNYIVIYIVNRKSKQVTIIRILYNRRDWLSLL